MIMTSAIPRINPISPEPLLILWYGAKFTGWLTIYLYNDGRIGKKQNHNESEVPLSASTWTSTIAASLQLIGKNTLLANEGSTQENWLLYKRATNSSMIASI